MLQQLGLSEGRLRDGLIEVWNKSDLLLPESSTSSAAAEQRPALPAHPNDGIMLVDATCRDQEVIASEREDEELLADRPNTSALRPGDDSVRGEGATQLGGAAHITGLDAANTGQTIEQDSGALSDEGTAQTSTMQGPCAGKGSLDSACSIEPGYTACGVPARTTASEVANASELEPAVPAKISCGGTLSPSSTLSQGRCKSEEESARRQQSWTDALQPRALMVSALVRKGLPELLEAIDQKVSASLQQVNEQE